MKKVLFMLPVLATLLFISCSDDDNIDPNLIEGSWGLVHSEVFNNEDPSEPLEWNYNCDPLNPSSYNDSKIDILKMEENKYYQLAYYWSRFSKEWIQEDEGYLFSISGNTITPISNEEEYNDVSFKILNLTSNSMTIEAKNDFVYYKDTYKKLE